MITILAFLFACSTEIEETDVDTATQEVVSCFEPRVKEAKEEEQEEISYTLGSALYFGSKEVVTYHTDYENNNVQIEVMFMNEEWEKDSFNSYLYYLRTENPHNLTNVDDYDFRVSYKKSDESNWISYPYQIFQLPSDFNYGTTYTFEGGFIEDVDSIEVKLMERERVLEIAIVDVNKEFVVD